MNRELIKGYIEDAISILEEVCDEGVDELEQGEMDDLVDALQSLRLVENKL